MLNRMRRLFQKRCARLLLGFFVLGALGLWVIRPIQGVANSEFGDRFHKILSYVHYTALYMTRSFRDPAFGLRISPSSAVKLDIVIPMIERDMETAVHTIASVRQMIMHPLGKIYLLAPDTPQMRAFAEVQGCILVPEKTAIPNFDSVKKQGGWILQQFLKLGADSFVEQENYLIIDADTVLLRPQVFINKAGQHLINVHWDHTEKHKRFNNTALGISQQYVLDFVPHHMMFNKTFLGALKQELSTRHGGTWWEALERLAKDDPGGISEYDLYATYVLTHHPAQGHLVANANITLHRDHVNALPNVIGAYAGNHKSLSMHHFILVDPAQKRT